MKKLIILFLLLPIFCSAQYDSTKNLQSIEAYGYGWKNAAFRFSIRLPKDTTKLAISDSGCLAVKGTTLYLWNGRRWVSNTSSVGSGIYVDSLTKSVSGCRVIYTTWKNGTGTNIDTAYRRDGIVTGGLILNRLNDSTFRISAAQYFIGCNLYNSPLDTITLVGTTGTGLKRFYTLGFDNTNNLFALAGTPSANPQIPQVNEATQIGRYTVFFPAGSDSGVTNIYNVTNVNGVDSGAIYSFTQLDSFNILACRRNGICDTLRSIYTAGGGGIDSLRRIGINVSALKNGTWRNQYTDSIGGGGSQGLDSVLNVNNNTDTTMNFVDSLNTTGSGKTYLRIFPRDYGVTTYATGRPSFFNFGGYGYYPGVNADGRPNQVMLIAGYNGGYNNPFFTNEMQWGIRAETWYLIGGVGHSEFHIFPEIKPITGVGRRLGSIYTNNISGYSTFNSQMDAWNILRGSSDTVQFASTLNRLLVGTKGVGDISLKNQDSTTSSTQWILGLNGTSFNNNVSTGAQPNNSFSFNSVVSVAPGTSYGSSATYAGIINSNVAVAGKYGYVIAQAGLGSSGFGGLGAPSINTSGQFDLIYGRNSGTGTIRAHLQTNTGGTASYVWSDQTTGQGWLASFTGGTTERSLHFNSSSYDSAFSIRGTDGKAKFRNGLNVGSGAYPVASAALQVTSTTQGFLPPVMTATQGSAISSPAEGLIIYVTNTNGTFLIKGWYGWNGTTWQLL